MLAFTEMRVDVHGKTILDAFDAIATGMHGVVSEHDRRVCAHFVSTMRKHPRVGKLIEQYVLRKYEQENGPVGTVDWQAILDWLLAHLPLFLQLLALFLAFI
jgi:hypothetical protein